MRVQDILRAPKKVLEWGKPQQGNMGPSVFPMSKRPKRCYRLGNVYRWRLIKFEAMNQKFRLLICYHIQIDKFQALLGCDLGNDNRLIAEYAYDPSHGAWHFHTICGDATQTPAGIMRGPWQRRIPKARNFHRRIDYTKSGAAMTDDEALQIAIKRFNLGIAQGSLFDIKDDGRVS